MARVGGALWIRPYRLLAAGRLLSLRIDVLPSEIYRVGNQADRATPNWRSAKKCGGGCKWCTGVHISEISRSALRLRQRSNVESTFSMIKRKFGDSVRSKTDVAMKNEVLAKPVCHNICCINQEAHGLGIDPGFQSAA